MGSLPSDHLACENESTMFGSQFGQNLMKAPALFQWFRFLRHAFILKFAKYVCVIISVQGCRLRTMETHTETHRTDNARLFAQEENAIVEIFWIPEKKCSSGKLYASYASMN